MNNLVGKLTSIGRSGYYWSFLIVLGLSMEGTALYFQYVLGDGPCVLCIQVRIWVLAIILLAIFGSCVVSCQFSFSD